MGWAAGCVIGCWIVCLVVWVVYNTSPMLLSKAQVVMTAAAVSLFMERHGFGYMTVFMRPTCGGTEADAIRGVPPVHPHCLRCRCRKCNVDATAILNDLDFWLKRHVALQGYLWRPSRPNMRALHVAVSRRVDPEMMRYVRALRRSRPGSAR